ncbi:polysaccharide deacetylase family protein [Hymenobacter monticola]|uniref:Polysaccharide deacetylase family protein n=1 Tax=Hymenobacter monticola TaxID=1705399 RepID=A0ABY4AYA6_9BACT|nr:polysaccharide deacetylase family protein [Hymenobacter monticola]UOE31865.1 polysaccharide deacetylase family protein [Hymenobacter monticola]
MIKALATFLSMAGVPAVLRHLRGPQSLTILSLHRVSAEEDYFWQPLHPDRFEALCLYVKRHYEVVNLRDLNLLAAPQRPQLVLSFDDGYQDFMEFALPVLVRHNLPANHNLVVACLNGDYTIWTQRLNAAFNQARQQQVHLQLTIGEARYDLQRYNNQWMPFYLAVFKALLQRPRLMREEVLTELETLVGRPPAPRMMTWADARSLANHNIEVGSHTYYHDVVSTIHDPAQLHQELVDSRRVLAERLQQPIDVLGLPNGQNSPHLQASIREAGYTCVLEVGDRGNALPLASATAPPCLHRINIVDELPSLAQLRLEVLAMKKNLPQSLSHK